MAKKKKAKNKKKVHRHQAARPMAAASASTATPVVGSAALEAPSVPLAAPAITKPAIPKPVPGIEAARWSYVGSDVRRIGILATACVVFELVLWYLFTYTGLGAAAYGLIK